MWQAERGWRGGAAGRHGDKVKLETGKTTDLGKLGF
jgi:hypothetical protein